MIAIKNILYILTILISLNHHITLNNKNYKEPEIPDYFRELIKKKACLKILSHFYNNPITYNILNKHVYVKYPYFSLLSKSIFSIRNYHLTLNCIKNISLYEAIYKTVFFKKINSYDMVYFELFSFEDDLTDMSNIEFGRRMNEINDQ